jgi:transposase-like protein
MSENANFIRNLTEEQKWELIKLYTQTDTPVSVIAERFNLKKSREIVALVRRRGFSPRRVGSGRLRAF